MALSGFLLNRVVSGRNCCIQRTLLVDDHVAVRNAMAIVLSEEGVGECIEMAGGECAAETCARELPDVALIDLSLNGALGFVEGMSQRGIQVLVCSTTREQPEYVRRAMAAGARGYITCGLKRLSTAMPPRSGFEPRVPARWRLRFP